MSASKATGAVVGEIEIYGVFRFSALLSRTWTQGDVSVGYVVDPETGEQNTFRAFPPCRTGAYTLLWVAWSRRGAGYGLEGERDTDRANP